MKKLLSLILCSLLLIGAVPFCQISADDTGKADVREFDKATLDKYMGEALALKEEIINSPTTVKWTGTAYYISSTGNDSADGLTPETAWKSLSKVSDADFLKPGDAVLFKRGDIFRTASSLKTKAGVTYSAYGSGAKPKLVGSIDASAKSLWEKTEFTDVYKYVKQLTFKDHDIGNIAFDMGRAWGIKMQDYIDNGTVSNGLTTFKSGGQHFENAGDLENDLEFWLDRETSYLYLKSVGGHPAERFASIEMADSKSGINGVGNDVTIDNLAISGFGGHGIAYNGIGSETTTGLTVQYCSFDFIGGIVQDRSNLANTGRLGNAVQIYGAGKDFTIHHCYAQNIYDCCWTIQYQSDSKGVDVYFDDIEMYKNVACYSNTGLEIWHVNHASYKNEATYGIRNMHLYDNYTYYNGYGWSWQRTNKNSNIFYGDPNLSPTNVYENNSVDNNIGMFARAWVNFLRYPGTPFYNFNNNVYFQHENLSIGGVPENADTAQGDPFTAKPFDKATLDSLTAKGFEPGTVYYPVPADFEIPEYEPEDIVPFDDVKNHWGYTNIEAAVMRGYMSGISEHEFAPNASMTRAMLATVLMRIYYEGGEIKDAGYTDVAKNAWYANAVNWAYTAGLVDPALDKFRPDAAATREEMADMLYRMALSQNKTKNYEDAKLEFKDAASVTPEYTAGISFATYNGIITGYTDGSVKPKNTATRAEVTTMIRRYVDRFAGIDTGYDAFGTASEPVIFDAAAISAMSVPTYCDKLSHTENGTSMLKLAPASIIYSAPTLTLFEKFAKIDFSDYPYGKIRYKTTNSGSSILVTYNKGENGNNAYYPTLSGAWNSTVFSVYDSLDNKIILENEDAQGQLRISPWGTTSGLPTYNVDYALIEYIAFFPTKADAEAYESELEKNSINVTFVSNGKTFAQSTALIGSTLTYPNDSPSHIEYNFEGWDIAEGTVLTGDTTVTAILSPKAGAPKVFFDLSNTVPKYSNMYVERKNENGIGFYRFIPSVKLSGDDTRAIVVLNSAGYDAAQAPFVKIGYRASNISSSIDFNINPRANYRLWGPRVSYPAKGEWVEQVLDFSSLNWTGGLGVDEGLSAKEYFTKYINEQLYAIMFKPYDRNGVTINDTDYFDVAYIAFFESKADADAFSLGLGK
ncbi:MAG: S-layer homology domain-containing protein [Clostridia bacterium]|nr:S-layer homology domain-containing protein [Clostridia bacterium]